MSLRQIINNYLKNLVPEKMYSDNNAIIVSREHAMIFFYSKPGLAENIIDLTYRIKKNTEMRFQGKNSYYPVNPKYKTSGIVNINCALSPYLQYAIASDVKYFGLVVRYAGMYLTSKKMAYRKRQLGLYPQNCGVKYPICSRYL